MACAATTVITKTRIISGTPVTVASAPVGNPAQNTKNDAPPEPIKGTPVNCTDFPLDGYETEEVYKLKVSKYFTLADLSIGGNNEIGRAHV